MNHCLWRGGGVGGWLRGALGGEGGFFWFEGQLKNSRIASSTEHSDEAPIC